MLNIFSLLGLFLLTTVGLRMIAKPYFIHKLIGYGLLSHAVNLMLLMSGSTGPQEKTLSVPSFLPVEAFENMVDPLPQALILTAIVIGFAVTGFLVVFHLSEEKDAEE